MWCGSKYFGLFSDAHAITTLRQRLQVLSSELEQIMQAQQMQQDDTWLQQYLSDLLWHRLSRRLHALYLLYPMPRRRRRRRRRSLSTYLKTCTSSVLSDRWERFNLTGRRVSLPNIQSCVKLEKCASAFKNCLIRDREMKTEKNTYTEIIYEFT